MNTPIFNRILFFGISETFCQQRFEAEANTFFLHEHKLKEHGILDRSYFIILSCVIKVLLLFSFFKFFFVLLI